MSAVGEIYDNLFDFESGKRTGIYPIHKNLKLDTPDTDLIDWVMSKVAFKKGDKVLDAGCGTGYSLIRLAEEKGITGTGISISKKEITYARELSKRANLENQLSLEEGSFDTLISAKYDKILALESLKHSKNIESTINNLTHSLSPGGVFIIADDFVIDHSSETERQSTLWNAPSFVKLGELEKILTKNNEFEVTSFDLTNRVPTRNKGILSALIATTQWSLMLPLTRSFRTLMETYLGGLILEYLYRRNAVSYILITAKKRTNHD